MNEWECAQEKFAVLGLRECVCGGAEFVASACVGLSACLYASKSQYKINIKLS